MTLQKSWNDLQFEMGGVTFGTRTNGFLQTDIMQKFKGSRKIRLNDRQKYHEIGTTSFCGIRESIVRRSPKNDEVINKIFLFFKI